MKDKEKKEGEREKGKNERKKTNHLYMCDIWKNPKRWNTFMIKNCLILQNSNHSFNAHLEYCHYRTKNVMLT